MHTIRICAMFSAALLTAQTADVRTYYTPSGKALFVSSTGSVGGLYGQRDCAKPGGQCGWEILRVSVKDPRTGKHRVLHRSHTKTQPSEKSLNPVSFAGPKSGSRISGKTKLTVVSADPGGLFEITRTISLVTDKGREAIRAVDRVSSRSRGLSDIDLGYIVRCMPAICGPDDPPPPEPGGPIYSSPVQAVDSLQSVREKNAKLVKGFGAKLNPGATISVRAMIPL